VLGLAAPISTWRLAALSDAEVKDTADSAAGHRRVERGLVPRALPRPSRGLARRRPRAAQGGSSPSTLKRTDMRAAGARFHPFQNLSAHFLLLALRYR
jgi:hypothetical protein